MHTAIAKYIDHTLLKADATTADIRRLCEEAAQHGFYSVCVNGSFVALCRELLAGSGVRVAAVCGFPLGAQATQVKAYEAAAAAEAGADEIDMVLPVGALLEGDLAAVERDIRAVVEAAGSAVKVKVILETGLLDDERKQQACRIAEQAGAAFVKTSTGFGPGGATAHDIRLMRAAVSPGIGVKASGGIRDYAAAAEMIDAGANRIGASASVAIVRGQAGASGY